MTARSPEPAGGGRALGEILPGPLDGDPAQLLFRGRADQDAELMLAAAVSQLLAAGVELGAYDRVILRWLSGWDKPTICVLASLLHRALTVGASVPAVEPRPETRRVTAAVELPTYPQVVRHADQLLGQTLDLLSSPWTPGTGPSWSQADAYADAGCWIEQARTHLRLAAVPDGGPWFLTG